MNVRDFELRYLVCAPFTLALLVQFIILIWLEKNLTALYYPFGVLFIIQDVAYNAVCGWIMFGEPPREWVFTTRLKKLDAAGQLEGCTIRFKQVLNDIDPGHV